MKSIFILTLLFAMPAAYAADTSERTYADPACSSRTANPDDCILSNGAPRLAIVPERKTGEEPPTPTPLNGGAFNPSKDKPAPQPTPQAGTSLTAPKKK